LRTTSSKRMIFISVATRRRSEWRNSKQRKSYSKPKN